MIDPKQKTDKKPAAAKGKRAPTQESAFEPLPAGKLTAQVVVPVSVGGRDWLRGGMTLKLCKTSWIADMVPFTEEQLAKLNDPKAKKKPGTLPPALQSCAFIMRAKSSGMAAQET